MIPLIVYPLVLRFSSAIFQLHILARTLHHKKNHCKKEINKEFSDIEQKSNKKIRIKSVILHV